MANQRVDEILSAAMPGLRGAAPVGCISRNYPRSAESLRDAK